MIAAKNMLHERLIQLTEKRADGLQPFIRNREHSQRCIIDRVNSKSRCCFALLALLRLDYKYRMLSIYLEATGG